MAKQVKNPKKKASSSQRVTKNKTTTNSKAKDEPTKIRKTKQITKKKPQPQKEIENYSKKTKYTKKQPAKPRSARESKRAESVYEDINQTIVRVLRPSRFSIPPCEKVQKTTKQVKGDTNTKIKKKPQYVSTKQLLMSKCADIPSLYTISE